jgi:copper(I)-binding protein
MTFIFRAARASTNPLPLFRASLVDGRIGIVGITLALLFFASQPLLAHEFEIGDLQIVHPWSRETPEGARVASGYVKIVNHGSQPDRLIAVTGEIAGRAEIHDMTVDDKGVMTMRPIDGLEIPANGEVEFKPGGSHIMFIDLKDTRKEGERFAGSLTFEKAGTVEIEFAVDAAGGKKEDPSHDMHGDSGHSHD